MKTGAMFSVGVVVAVSVAASLPTETAHAQEIGRASTRPDYFAGLKTELKAEWPNNRLVRFVFHGHSVPAGYFKTPRVQKFDSYPVLFHQALCELFPTATIDVCTTAVGGENSASGAARFKDDVLALKPDVVFIDYCLNDRRLGIEVAEKHWRNMIELALAKDIKVVLLTPTPDARENILAPEATLAAHSKSIRDLARELEVPVIDSYEAFREKARQGTELSEFLSQSNHPNRRGHQIVADLMLALFE